MALNDYEWKWRGLTFGKDLPVKVEFVEGLDDLTARVGDIALPRNHGAIRGLHTAAPREVVMSLTVLGDARSQELADTLADVYALFNITDDPYPLVFKEPGVVERRINARVIGRSRRRNPSTTFGREQVLLRLTAADPRIYSEAEYSTLMNPYDGTGGGADYDFDYGIDFTIDSSAETIVNNAGDAKAYPLLRFYGPVTGTVTGVQVTNTTTGVVFDLNSSLLTGQILDADMKRIITSSPEDTPYISLGGSSRWGDWQLPRTPLYLAPGDNALRFEVTGTSTDAKAVVTWRDTWL